MTIEFKATQHFDPERCRQYINDELSVFHCHHYATLFTQLAEDASKFKGDIHLADAAEDSMGPVLKKYYKDNGIQETQDRISIVEQYYAFVGLGELKIIEATEDSGEVEMPHSHVDEGWIKKWGKRKNSINFMGRGFLAGAFSAIFDKDFKSYNVEELQSIVCGAEKSTFKVTKK